jgi:dTDP-4-dehydrorhamnose 3,5-epimerase
MQDTEIFIVGAKGQLGQALQARYPGAQSADIDELDITDWESVRNYDWSGIKTIINAAAYTNVDNAETAEGRPVVWKVNATGPGYLSKIATEHGVTLVHISSDYVFDGSNENHTEDEPVAPLGVYAQAKAAGDIAVSITPQYYILRIQALIGEGHNFARIMMGLAEKNIAPTVVNDQITRLTFTPTLVDGIDHLLRQNAPYGIYNLTNDGQPASWADITRLIFEAIDRSDLTVTNTTTENYFKSKPHVAPRPLKSWLDLTKIKAAGFNPSDWRTELQAYIQKEQA